MSNYTHQNAPTYYNILRRRGFASRTDASLQRSTSRCSSFMHFTGTMDHWDPALTDGFALDREVILFNNAGISSSSGEVPGSVEEMAQHAAAFIDALGIMKIDALGFSMGGFVAQQFTIDRPDLVPKLMLVGTCPRSGEWMAAL
jgi:pimeloyl-ACP methyl ester carboxylesterase